MKKSKGSSKFLLFMLTCFLVLHAASFSKVLAAEIFSDDFESYTQSTFPVSGGWQIIHNGAGDAYQYIDNSHAVSGTQSFHTMGSSCWAASLSNSLTIPNRVRLEAKVFVDQLVTCGCTLLQAQVGLWRSDDTMWAGAIIFGCDGNIYASTQSGFPLVFLTSYSVGTWYDVRVDYDYTSKTFDAYIDGVLRGPAIPILDDLTNKMPNAVRVGAVHGSNPIAWFDDVKVSEITCLSPPSNMVSWWPAENSAIDIVDGNNGTIINNATFTPGMVGQAFDFGGNGDYVQVSSPAGLPVGSSPRTMMFWFKTPIAWGDNFQVVIQYGGNTTGSKFGIYIPDYYSRTMSFWGESSDFSGSTPLQLDTWYHGAVTYDGSTVSLYLNGQFETSSAKSLNTTINFGGFTIGRTSSFDNITSEWNGLVDEVAIFNRALTQTEIQDIYNAGFAGTCKTCITPPADMISWWSGDGHPFDLIDDNDGTLVGNATYADGKVGKAFSFDGVESNYVEIPNSSSLNPTGAFTIDGWFYIDPVAPGNAGEIATLIAKTEGSTNNGWALYFDDRWGTKSLKFVLGSVIEFQSAILTADWYHIAGVFDLTTPRARLYINGVQVADSASGGASPNALNVRIGAMYWTDSYHQGNDRLNGKADEVEFFNRALSAEEIAAIYAAGSAGKCKPCFTPPSDMVSWWPGDEHPFDIVDDNDGTMMNVATYAQGLVGKAFSFDGVDDYVEIPNSASLNSGSTFTVDGWFYIDPNSPENSGDLSPLVAKSSSGSAEGGWWLIFDDRDWTGDGSYLKSIRFSVMNGTPGQHNQATAPNLITSASWYHVAGVYDQSATPKAKLYLNGALAAQSIETYTYLSNTIAMRIGAMHDREYYGGTQNWKLKGLADEVEFFNRALSAEEIAAIYAAGSAGKCKIQPEPDADGDGIPDATDNCPNTVNADQADTDQDGVGDACDNCINAPNLDQADADLDGFGDACDECPNDPNKTTPGACGCGVADTDTDGDGVADCIDNCPSTYNPDQQDTNHNGIGDACENGPDLIGKWQYLKCYSSKICYGLSKVDNIGDKNAGRFAVSYYLSDNGTDLGTLIRKNTILVIKAGRSYYNYFYYSSKVSLSGKYVIAVIDSDNKIIERDENNNRAVRLIP